MKYDSKPADTTTRNGAGLAKTNVAGSRAAAGQANLTTVCATILSELAPVVHARTLVFYSKQRHPDLTLLATTRNERKHLANVSSPGKARRTVRTRAPTDRAHRGAGDYVSDFLRPSGSQIA